MDIEEKKGQQKGARGIAETALFANRFPLNVDRTKEKIITVEEFDKWAAANDYYSLNCEGATVLDSRNKLRKKINYTACSQAWLDIGQVAFAIEVHEFGRTYKVHHADDAFAIRADKLPRQVKSYATTKRRAIQALLESIDMETLPPAMQFRIGGLDREVDRFLRGIDYQITELNREYDSIKAMLTVMVEQKLITPENHAIANLLGVDDDE